MMNKNPSRWSLGGKLTSAVQSSSLNEFICIPSGIVRSDVHPERSSVSVFRSAGSSRRAVQLESLSDSFAVRPDGSLCKCWQLERLSDPQTVNPSGSSVKSSWLDRSSRVARLGLLGSLTFKFAGACPNRIKLRASEALTVFGKLSMSECCALYFDFACYTDRGYR